MSADLLEALTDLGTQLRDMRGSLRRIEGELELVRSLVMSHGERLSYLERDSITPPPRRYTEGEDG